MWDITLGASASGLQAPPPFQLGFRVSGFGFRVAMILFKFVQ